MGELGFRRLHWFWLLLVLLPVCQDRRLSESMETALLLDWYKHAVFADRFVEGNKGPVAARNFAYLGIAGYVASRPFLPVKMRPLQKVIYTPDLPEITHPEHYFLPAILNSCYHDLSAHFFYPATMEAKEKKMVLYTDWFETIKNHTDSATLSRSEDYGRRLAQAIYQWSTSDKEGHQANLHNFDRNYALDMSKGHWEPTSEFPMPPLLPHYGQARTFAICPEDYLAQSLPEFTSDAKSVFYHQALELYSLSNPLSKKNKWIAEFWSDDHTGITFSPPTRWVSIANQVMERERPGLVRMIELYLKLGLALNDATIACWQSKYYYTLLRPETFIKKYIDFSWHPLGHTPSFPGYPSGHSIMGAVAAEVLTAEFGDHFAMTDRSHEGRKEFLSAPRSYTSFRQMAEENAFSRIALGVHFRIDCEEGLRLGYQIGQVVNNMTLRENSDLSSR